MTATIDPRTDRTRLETPDAIIVEGSRAEGFYVHRNGVPLARYYEWLGPEGESACKALDAYRALQRREDAATQPTS